jgi:hypothetical protein
MTDDTIRQKRGPSDATDYSSSKAPETQKEAVEDHPHPSDPRLTPGGPHGSAADPGMSSLDRDIPPSGGYSPGQQDIGSTRNPE